MKTTHKNSGFTLIELMIALVVGSILLAMTVPSFQSAMKNNRNDTQADLLYGSLMVARSEAVTRNSSVTVCKKSVSADTCVTTDDWSYGWLIFADTDSDQVVDGGETIISKQAEISGSIKITSDANFVTFIATGGMSTDATLSSGSFSFKVCDEGNDQNYMREVKLNITGRAQKYKGTLSCT